MIWQKKLVEVYLLGTEHGRLLEQCEWHIFFPELFLWNSD
jgi:hypothetical protein